MTCTHRHTILILDNSLDMGGVEKKLFDLIPRFDRGHFNIVVCCLKDGGYYKKPLENMGVRFYDGLLGHKYDVLAYAQLDRIIRDERVDLIYSFLHPNTVFFSFLAKSTGRVRAWVVSIHATGSPTGGRLLKPYLRPFLKRVDRFIAVAHAHKEYLARTEGLPEDGIAVIYNGVDSELYRPAPERPGLRAALGLRPHAPVVVAIASLKPAKCIDVLLAAAARTVGRVSEAEFLIIGDGPERKNLETMARELGIGGRVVFTGVRDDVYDLLRLGSLFVLPAKRGTETFPNVLLEAMATSLPVVSTDVGSVREMVEDGASALLVPPEDPEALASAMTDLLLLPEKRAAFGQRGRSIVLDRFTLEAMRTKREALFAELLCAAE
ncbi:MAG: glycosyltransferase [Chitinivibrionia bacterium]|nr:glycosyltransferase [Chitinivibrionia bacterium]